MVKNSLKATKNPAKVNVLRGFVSSKLLLCWTTKIRTWTNRTKTCCAAKIEVCKQTSKYFVHFFTFYRVNRALLLCNQQIIVLFTALNKQIFLIKQVGCRNYLVKSRQLFFIQRNASALNQLTHFTFRSKYSRIINE